MIRVHNLGISSLIIASQVFELPLVLFKYVCCLSAWYNKKVCSSFRILLIVILIEVYTVSNLESLWKKLHGYFKFMFLCLSHFEPVHLVAQLGLTVGICVRRDSPKD